MRKESVIVAAVLAISIAVPGVATAETGFRAGAPALDQYVETLPDAGGNKPANHSGDGGSSSGTDSSGDTYSPGTGSSEPASSISAPRPPSSELSKLRASGSDGGATANAIEAISGGAAISGGVSSGSGATGSDLLPLDSADGDSPFAGIVSVLTGSGPGGPALPAVLLTVLAGGIFLGTRGLGRDRGSSNRR